MALRSAALQMYLSPPFIFTFCFLTERRARARPEKKAQKSPKLPIQKLPQFQHQPESVYQTLGNTRRRNAAFSTAIGKAIGHLPRYRTRNSPPRRVPATENFARFTNLDRQNAHTENAAQLRPEAMPAQKYGICRDFGSWSPVLLNFFSLQTET